MEREVLAWFAGQEHRLAEQVVEAQIAAREATSIGFFTELQIPPSLPAIVGVPQGSFAFEGCAVFSSNVDPYAECILHLVDGRIRSLEIYSVGTGNPIESVVFDIRPININRVDMRASP